MNALLRLRPLLTAGLTLAVVVAGGVLAHGQVTSAPPPPATTTEPVQSSVLLCPEPGANAELGVRVTAAVVPDQPGQDVPGRAVLQTLPGAQSAREVITDAGGQAQIDAFGEKLPPIRVTGTGGLAPGLVADQWGRDPRGTGRGMASTACAPAASQFWFVGGGAVVGRRTRIVLVNPDENAAVVDLEVFGPEGLLDTPGGRGLVIPAQARAIVQLDSLAPGVRSTAVHVNVRTGRVGASVADDQMSGLDAVGTDWLPSAAAPATTVYVPGLNPGPGGRVLSILAPGDQDANVRIQIMSASGVFAPAERDTVQVPAGTVISLDMAPVTDAQPATLMLTSDQPIAAGLRQFYGSKDEQNETSYSAGSAPFTGTAAVSGLPVRQATEVRLAITAVDADASVSIRLLPYSAGNGSGELTAAKTVQVKAGNVAWVPLTPPAGTEWYTAVVSTDEGSAPVLVAHRVLEASDYGDLVTGYPWTAMRTEVQVPQAEQDPGVTVR